MKGGIHFTESLSSNDRREIQTDLWERFKKYAVEMV
jgi:hypothetical protein